MHAEADASDRVVHIVFVFLSTVLGVCTENARGTGAEGTVV